jgi:hypothetical protein
MSEAEGLSDVWVIATRQVGTEQCSDDTIIHIHTQPGYTSIIHIASSTRTNGDTPESSTTTLFYKVVA